MQFPFATLYHSCEREKWENEILLTHEVEETRKKNRNKWKSSKQHKQVQEHTYSSILCVIIKYVKQQFQ